MNILKIHEEIKAGGAWLYAARSWMQTNITNGDTMLWSSTELVKVPFNQLEHLALKAAVYAIDEDRRKRQTAITWVNMEDDEPEIGKNVIAVGDWWGEIRGTGESDYMGIGTWTGSCVDIDSDTYSTQIINVTKWAYIPAHPI